MKRTRIFVLVGLLTTGCAGLIAVPDLDYDPSAAQGGGQANGDGGVTPGTNPPGTNPPGVTPPGTGPDGSTPTCNADLKTDKANCGACNHDCTNGTCADGVCTLRGTLEAAASLAVQNNSVYVGTLSYETPNGLWSCATNGCATTGVDPKQISFDDDGDAGALQDLATVQITTTASHVYAADENTSNEGALWMADIDGTNFKRVIPRGTLSATSTVALSTNDIFFGEDFGPLWTCPLDGTCTSPTKLAPVGHDEVAWVAATADGHIIFADDGGDLIWYCESKAKCSGADVKSIANDGANYIRRLQVDGNTAYWKAGKKIMRCTISPTPCATPDAIFESAATDTVVGFTVRGTSLFVSTITFESEVDGTFVDHSGAVHSCEIGGCTGASVKDLAKGQEIVLDMTVDAKSVYWISGTNWFGTYSGAGALRKAPR